MRLFYLSYGAEHKFLQDTYKTTRKKITATMQSGGYF